MLWVNGLWASSRTWEAPGGPGTTSQGLGGGFMQVGTPESLPSPLLPLPTVPELQVHLQQTPLNHCSPKGFIPTSRLR